jgi:hypothetical protein
MRVEPGGSGCACGCLVAALAGLLSVAFWAGASYGNPPKGPSVVVDDRTPAREKRAAAPPVVREPAAPVVEERTHNGRRVVVRADRPGGRGVVLYDLGPAPGVTVTVPVPGVTAVPARPFQPGSPGTAPTPARPAVTPAAIPTSFGGTSPGVTFMRVTGATPAGGTPNCASPLG